VRTAGRFAAAAIGDCHGNRCAGSNHDPARLSREQQLLSHEEGKPMAAHKFKSGQQVTVVPHRPSGVTGGTFKIVRLLPEERGVWQYRVKCVADGHERVVLESDITH
jgi:hypothetical protein